MRNVDDYRKYKASIVGEKFENAAKGPMTKMGQISGKLAEMSANSKLILMSQATIHKMQQKSLMSEDKTLDQVLTQQIGQPLGTTGGNIFESDKNLHTGGGNSSQQQTRGK